MKSKVVEDADVVTEAVSVLTQFARAERLEAAQITAVGAFERATAGLVAAGEDRPHTGTA